MRARKRSNDGRPLLLGEAAFPGHVFALPATAGEAGLPVLASFREAPAGTTLGLGAKSLAGLKPLGAAFCIRRRSQSQNQRRGSAESGAHKRKFSHFCLPSRLNPRANAKRVSAYLQSGAGVNTHKPSNSGGSRRRQRGL